MGLDTYLVIPAKEPEKARALLDPGREETTRLGTDYLVLHLADRFVNVEKKAEEYGSDLVRSMPRAMRKALDPRGIAAYPEAGQSFHAPTYAELLAAHGAPLWLPTTRARRLPRDKRVLLVSLSPAREKQLLANPELVADIVGAHVEAPFRGSIEVEHWVEVQRTLLDAWSSSRRDDDDRTPYAVTPRSGMPLYEDETVDAARWVRASEVAQTAAWLAALPDDVVPRTRAFSKRSAAARDFPGSLGTAPVDDAGPAGAKGDDAPPSPEATSASLGRLIAFYSELARNEAALLAIRFRA